VDFDAVVLAGGGGTRLGGADKGGLTVGGISLLDHVLEASAAARHTVVVGVPRPTMRVVEWTLEQPPGGGPMAGLAAGVAVLERVTPPAPVVVLATDLPYLRSDDVSRLVAALATAEPQVDAAVFVDGTQNVQPLTAVYRRAELARAIADQQPVANRPMRAMLSSMTMIAVPDRGAAADIDTAEQLASARHHTTEKGSA
jgi:molybdopterin-guanine dinucleotide biosynthesis protein A